MYVKTTALAAAALLACVNVTPASAASVENGVRLNGFRINGIQLNGWQINGTRLQGNHFNGMRMNGVEWGPAALAATPSVLAIELPGGETLVRR